MSYSVPKCCLSCYNRECGEDEHSGRQFSYCLLNIWFPTKKQTCKRCRPMKAEILALCDDERRAQVAEAILWKKVHG